jgi:hypothetical protein
LKPFQQYPPKKPIDGNWIRCDDPPKIVEAFEGYRYLSPLGLRVISSVHVVENADGSGHSPHYHISITDNGKRVPASVVPLILKQFGAIDFEEDNHAPRKILRSFWKRIDGKLGECPCKDEVKPETDGDYTWREK